MEKNLKDYPSLAAFFARKLRHGSRTIDVEAPIVSPVDGKVLHVGLVEGNRIEQVKGVDYSLVEFMGHESPLQPRVNELAAQYLEAAAEGVSRPLTDKRLYYMVFYLGPGDYHGIHSPTDWTVKQTRHFPGFFLFSL